MGVSQSDVHRIAGFVRKVTKAANAETVISETVQILRDIAEVQKVRIVHTHAPGRWTEWKAAPDTLEVRHLDKWPAPRKNALTQFFDSENLPSGFISVDTRGEKIRSMLDVLAPGLWSALLLQSALARVQKAALSEAELVRATLRARDEERRHIARELHDDLGQSLASLKLALKWAEDMVRKKTPPEEIIAELSNAREGVGVMLDKMRDLSHTLYPRILDTLGLATAVKELAHQAARHSGMRIDCSTRGRSKPLDKEVAVALYRCCQEAINNAIRHSQASTLTVVVRFGQEEVEVIVEDDGKGFDPRTLYDSNSRMMSPGFWTIRQRMADLEAAFRVSTAKGRGTVVEMMVPYSSRKADDRSKNKAADRR